MSSSTDEPLTLESVDPVTFQIIKHRLTQVVDEAVETLKRVSGSPNTNEAHDLMMALYTDEGDLLTGGVGFLHHYIGASRATKHVIEYYGEDVNEGDVFLLNDPYTAAFHPPDVYIISPIYYDGELQAFAANFVHVNDVGSVDPGGFSPNSTSIFHEGFQTPGLKLVDAGEMRQDVLDTILNMSRDPGMLELDLRSQIAATNVAEDRFKSLLEEYGATDVTAVGDELIRHTENRISKRLEDLPDGRWEARQYVDSVPEDELFTVELALEKEGDSLTFDFEGTDEQAEYGINCTYWATVGGVLAPLLPLLCSDMTWNDGLIRPLEVNAPSGTLVNAERPAPISIATVATLQVCNCLSSLVVSKMVGSSDEYADRSTGIWHGAHGGYIVEATVDGHTNVDVITDTYAGAAGARAFDDGVDLGGELVNVVSRWANAERHESTLPIAYLYRRFVADSGGPGEYRGGVGHEHAIAPVGDVDSFETVTFGRGVDVSASTGVFGGYPGCTTEYTAYRDTDVWAEETDLPPSSETLESAETESAVWGQTPFEVDDFLHVRMAGSGGYGDPLRRDADRVATDVAAGKITPDSARDVYGVPVTADGEIDGDVTARRDSIREARLAESERGEPPIGRLEAESTDRRLGPYLPVVTDGDAEYVACECETVLSPATESWKDRAAVRERDLSNAGAGRDVNSDVILREFVCPSCATLLDTEVAGAGDPYLESRLF
ncbi:hydantoinase B/oxoprolinase family protein [Natrarchaeobius chitinivorans]|uniref:Hydantoinase B/oxoprolinase family protein n=1 Tax=Natrarchaeobius chitinivorans TaxID=1679083 RepID=A0A3N6MFB0_NATCH|nr:hydantoinase B/oxoprolinase family protein [Natrarchaeobius chitinivorans]RQG95400.1 hydantoinase B/oxoprolinase family protein [Natrarchaeobius chitinivorans]